MSKYDDDPVTGSDDLKVSKRLHHSVVINGRDANVSVEITESIMPTESVEDFSDRTSLIVCRELDVTTDTFRKFFDRNRRNA